MESGTPAEADYGDYADRINRAIDHVTHNLREPLKLEDVARVACFSPFHFHRVFRALTGETLHAFVKRARLERALFLMSHQQGAKLTHIALECGFSSSSDFSRSFRAEYGVPPRVFDVERFRQARREKMAAKLQVPAQRLARGENPDKFAVRLREVGRRRVAYLRVTKPYAGDRVPRAIARMMAWAEQRGLADGQWLGYQWDDPELVALERCRYDVGLEVPEGVRGTGEVGVATFPEMRLAEVDISGSVDLELRALEWLYGTWLPQSGFVPDHQPMFEAWRGRPFAHGMTHFEVTVQLAVVR